MLKEIAREIHTIAHITPPRFKLKKIKSIDRYAKYNGLILRSKQTTKSVGPFGSTIFEPLSILHYVLRYVNNDVAIPSWARRCLLFDVTSIGRIRDVI